MTVVVLHTLMLTAPSTVLALHIAFLSDVAVTFFFALSGFLLALPFLRAVADGSPRPSIPRYCRQRALRIFPAYVVIFLIADLALRAVYVTNALTTGRARSDAGTGRILDPLRLIEHLTLTQNFIPGEMQTGVNPAWSLTTEISFYALLPVLAIGSLLAVRRGVRRLRAALLPAAALLAIGLVSKVIAIVAQNRSGLSAEQAQFGANAPAVFNRSLLASADAFGWGFAVAVLYVFIQRGEAAWWTRRRVRILAGSVFAVSAIAGRILATSNLHASAAFFSVASSAVILLMVTPADTGRPSWVARFADHPPFHRIGVWSLSLYLWHYPVLLVAVRERWIGTATGLGPVQSLAVVLGISLVLSWITYELVEKPAMRTARGSRSRRTLMAP